MNISSHRYIGKPGGWLLIFVGIVILVGIVATIVGSVESGETGEAASSEALSMLGMMPSFSLVDVEGNTVSSDDFVGKTLVVNAWATWCPFCVDELPDFATVAAEFGDEVTVIAINRRESQGEVEAFLEELAIGEGIVFLFDPSDSFYQSIGGFAMPETLFVDAAGEIRIHKRGPMELSEIREKAQAVLGAAAP